MGVRFHAVHLPVPVRLANQAQLRPPSCSLQAGQDADGRPDRAFRQDETPHELGHETLRSQCLDILLRNRLNAVDGDVIHRQFGVQPEIGDQDELAGAVPAARPCVPDG